MKVLQMDGPIRSMRRTIVSLGDPEPLQFPRIDDNYHRGEFDPQQTVQMKPSPFQEVVEGESIFETGANVATSLAFP